MNAWLLRHAKLTTAVTVILGFGASVLIFFGADLPPWASMTRAQTVAEALRDNKVAAKQDIEEVKRDQSVMTRALLRLDRQYWEKQLEEAEKDLKVNPESVTAKKAKREATEQIAYIDETMKPARSP